MISSRERRQGQLLQELCSDEDEFATHQSIDSASNHDGGWCEFPTACEGNYQYFTVMERSSSIKNVIPHFRRRYSIIFRFFLLNFETVSNRNASSNEC